MTVVGIIFGVLAAVGLSLSYLFSRSYQLSRPNGLAKLMVIAHLLQGVLSAALLTILWRPDIPPLSQYWAPLLGTTCSYLVGHVALFFAVRHADASRVSPLMGFKLVVLAVIAVGFAGQHLAPRQWLAVAIAVGGVLVLNRIGGRMPWRALLGVGVACLAYSLSDLFLQRHIQALAPVPLAWAAVFAAFMGYALCGLVAVAAFPWLGSRKVADWKASVPYAVTWYATTLLFFMSVAFIGVVFANLLQSTRAIWSVALGALVARWGLNHLEQQTTRGVFARRIAAAVMMVAAVALYSSADTERPDTDPKAPVDAAARQLERVVQLPTPRPSSRLSPHSALWYLRRRPF